jgi:ribosomal-protein-alanine N-acetyltransferase
MIDTERLRLRRWEPRDRAPFAALNADPEVMRHFPRPLARAESDAMVGRLLARWERDGFCFGVAERRADGAFVGMVGLARVQFPLPRTAPGAIEVGWRLARPHWGRGYATEAARAWLAWGFATRGLAEIVAFAVPANHRSQAVMRRLGMASDPARTFEHPQLDPGHPLRQHLLFAIGRNAFDLPPEPRLR